MAQTTRKAAAKKTTAKKPVRRKPTVSKAAAASAAQHESFKVTRETDFFKFQLTIQTLYWAVIAVLVIGLTFWVYSLQAQITDIYDSIELNSIQDEVVAPAAKDKTE